MGFRRPHSIQKGQKLYPFFLFLQKKMVKRFAFEIASVTVMILEGSAFPHQICQSKLIQ